jgi:hypothetical protein
MVALEAVLVTAGGGVLATLFAAALGAPVSLITIAAAMGGLNGLASGLRRVYDWADAKGWAAFVLDSSWGLLGSALGLVVHLGNLHDRRAVYRADHSRRRNRHVYEHGFRLKRGYLVTLGNVISNASGEGERIEDRPGRVQLIDRHEDLHVWQNRVFGVGMQATYVLWAAGGVFVGFLYWLVHRDEDLGAIVMTTAYLDNPFEYWAYRRDRNWPPAGAHPGLRWPGRVG